MLFTLLGTGCPQVDTRRFGPSQIVRHHGATYLIDCGSGTTQRLLAAGGSGADIDAVFLTHLHSDHIVDLFQLIISSWHQGRNRPQYVYGPKGTKRYVHGLLKLWQPEFKQRIAHEKRTSTAALGAEVKETKAGEIFRAGEMVVTAVKVDHYPVRPAFGFLFETPEARLAISGDTTYCPELIEAARGIDVLVHEVYIHRGPQPSMLVEDPGSRNVQNYHTSSDVVGRVAREAEAGVSPAQPFRADAVRRRGIAEPGERRFRRPHPDRRGSHEYRCGQAPGAELGHVAGARQIAASAEAGGQIAGQAKSRGHGHGHGE